MKKIIDKKAIIRKSLSDLWGGCFVGMAKVPSVEKKLKEFF